MKPRRFTASVIFALALTPNLIAADRPHSQWVHPGPDGRLVYKTTDRGDRIMDFSHAGYRGGGVALPTVPVAVTLKPSGSDDDTATIQNAINDLAGKPLSPDGFRGAVLLSPGVYPCSQTITIPASGIVLRGSGSTGANRSTIKMTGAPHLALAIRPPGNPRNNPTSQPADSSAQTTIADPYVPSGATSFTVADATGFNAGDLIAIRRPVTEKWVEFMGMHDMTRDGRPQTWIRPGSVTTTERTITRIDGNKLTLDVPLSDSFDAAYTNPPGTIVAKLAPPPRITHSAIESLHVESPPQAISHSQPHHSALRIAGEDLWARDLAIDETMNSVATSGKRITLQHVHITRKARHQGASRPAEFAPNASQVLLDRCTVTADNVWFVATGAGIAGPMVILNSTFTGDGRAESHQRWSTGMLYDNVRAPQGAIEIRNRGSMGSGHGWSLGWGVVWNCTAEHYILQNPPGAMNWLIGSIGPNKPAPRPFGSGPDLPGGTIDSPDQPVAPASLYLAQLHDRLGPQALRNIGYTTPTDLPPPTPPSAP